MTREIRNTPHPTPNPDGPHAIGSSRGAETGAVRSAKQEGPLASDEHSHDSYGDDLNLILSDPLSEPDPALKSQLSPEAVPRSFQDGPTVPAYVEQGVKQPRTSEVFQCIGPETIDVTHPTADACAMPAAYLTENSPDPESDAGNDFATSLARGRLSRTALSASDDDQVADFRVPWALLLLMSYSSAVTLAMTWALWTGRSLRSPQPPVAEASASELESAPKIVDSAPVGPLPPLPAENVVGLGETVRLGDLEVMPLDIVSDALELVRSIEPTRWRREKSPALVLRLKLRNLSTNRAFSPVDRRFLREQTGGVDRSSIVTSDGKSINMFPLALDSEWSIMGQDFHSLDPGESMETVIASEPGAERQLTDESIWRVRLRIGPYRTDVLGVRFHKNEITR